MLVAYPSLILAIAVLLLYAIHKKKTDAKLLEYRTDFLAENESRTSFEAKYYQAVSDINKIEMLKRSKDLDEIQLLFAKVNMIDDKITFLDSSFKSKLETIMLSLESLLNKIENNSNTTQSEPLNNHLVNNINEIKNTEEEDIEEDDVIEDDKIEEDDVIEDDTIENEITEENNSTDEENIKEFNFIEGTGEVEDENEKQLGEIKYEENFLSEYSNKENLAEESKEPEIVNTEDIDDIDDIDDIEYTEGDTTEEAENKKENLSIINDSENLKIFDNKKNLDDDIFSNEKFDTEEEEEDLDKEFSPFDNKPSPNIEDLDFEDSYNYKKEEEKNTENTENLEDQEELAKEDGKYEIAEEDREAEEGIKDKYEEVLETEDEEDYEEEGEDDEDEDDEDEDEENKDEEDEEEYLEKEEDIKKEKKEENSDLDNTGNNIFTNSTNDEKDIYENNLQPPEYVGLNSSKSKEENLELIPLNTNEEVLNKIEEEIADSNKKIASDNESDSGYNIKESIAKLKNQLNNLDN